MSVLTPVVLAALATDTLASVPEWDLARAMVTYPREWPSPQARDRVGDEYTRRERARWDSPS